MSDDDQLGKSLADLSGVALTEPLRAVLTKIAMFAAQAIPGADGAGLALIEERQPDTVVASAPFVRDVDDAQYRLGEGPCLQACKDRRTQISTRLGAEPRWPRFGVEAARLGVESALSLPLEVEGDLIGSLNVYGTGRDAFAEDAVRVGELFADPAAVSVANARLLLQNQRLLEDLTKRLSDQASALQTISTVMSRVGDSAARALETVQAMNKEGARIVARAHQVWNLSNLDVTKKNADVTNK
ncbi:MULTISPECIES: GAF domain-containing protein [Frankia]|nr:MULTISPECIES: GAF domain-containing protein [Frankia]